MPENDTNQTQNEPSLLARAVSGLTGLIEHFKNSSGADSDAQKADPEDNSGATQRVEDGSGPILERTYTVKFTSHLTPQMLMKSIKANLADYSPETLAAFEKSSGHPWAMRVGDEYTITILGPWNGSVRVIESAPTSFSFVTLEGHPEAGTIRFTVAQHPAQPGVLDFQIRSRARARDALVQAAYSALKVGQAIQESMWTTFCQRVVEAAGGQVIGRVEVSTTETRPAEDKVHGPSD